MVPQFPTGYGFTAIIVAFLGRGGVTSPGRGWQQAQPAPLSVAIQRMRDVSMELKPPAKPKLADVARAAGGLRSAPPRTSSPTPSGCGPTVRERVEAAARALGYLGPDPTARLLRAGKVNAIGVIPPGNWGVHDALRNPVYLPVPARGGRRPATRRASTSLVSSDLHRPGARLGGGGRLHLLRRVEHLGDIEPARLRRLPFVVHGQPIRGRR